MPPPRKSVMSERQQMQMILQMSGDSKAAAKTTPGTTAEADEKPVVQHAKKSIPVELKSKQQSPEGNDDALMSSASNIKEEGSICIKEGAKSEETQQLATMSAKDTSDKSQSGTPSPQTTQSMGTKRNFAEIENTDDVTTLNPTEADETKRKKRKDGNSTGSVDSSKDKEVKSSGAGNKSNVQQKTAKQSSGSNQNIANIKGNGGSGPSSLDGKSPCGSPKVAVSGSTEGESDDVKDVPKVPPLKIVIPSSLDNDNGHGGNPRNGKNSSTRNAPLPYVVTSSNSNDATEKTDSTSRCNSPADSTKGNTEEKSSSTKSEEGATGGRAQQRVLRSSNRNAERSSNNSSPQMQGNNSSSVSPAPKEDDSSKVNENTNAKTSSPANNSTDDSNATNTTETDAISTSQTQTTATTTTSNELHPRKRKIKQKQDDNPSKASAVTNQTGDTSSNSNSNTTTDHPHDHPFTNCYQMFMDIRKQIEQKHKNIIPIQPKPPQGFNDYLMNRKTYLLADKAPPADDVQIQIPGDVASEMKELYTNQERERVKLKLQHIVEKEKLGLCVEQEILRVHAKAARSLANQSVPYSACTMLKDEEIYNVITPEQEEKDRNARSRYNGRLFLSWLQDVDDKWEKIKEAMILRHHNEAESLHAVQRMDWEFALVEKGLHGFKIHPDVKDEHVPIVPVSDEFDLLPA